MQRAANIAQDVSPSPTMPLNLPFLTHQIQYLGPVDVPIQAGYTHRDGDKTMRALAWFGNEDVRMIDAPIPDITEPEDVIIRVTGTTICGSDLHLYACFYACNLSGVYEG
jgi:hypothetical protein